MSTTHWCIITPEYFPALPHQAGMGDGARLMAIGLAKKGQKVLVLAPDGPTSPEDPGVHVKRVLGNFGPDGWVRASCELSKINDNRRLFLQWIPHGYGYKSVNIFLIVWLIWRVLLRRDCLYVMVHEPFLPFQGKIRQKLAATAHRLMVFSLLRLASKVFAGNKKWIEELQPWKPKHLKVKWLPVFSNVPFTENPHDVRRTRDRLFGSGSAQIVGHFGTYGAHTRDFLWPVFSSLLDNSSNVNLLLLGRGGLNFRSDFVERYPHLESRILATGDLSQSNLSIHLQTCDLMVQPYYGGLSTRNGSLMALLLHRLPVVGNFGSITDKEWYDWGAVELVKEGDCQAMVDKSLALLDNRKERVRLSDIGYKRYLETFSLQATIDALLS